MENKFQILNLVASVMMMGACCVFIAFIMKAWGRISHLTALVNALWDAELKRHEPKREDEMPDYDTNDPQPNEFSEKLATGWMTTPERRKYWDGFFTQDNLKEMERIRNKEPLAVALQQISSEMAKGLDRAILERNPPKKPKKPAPQKPSQP